MTEEEQFDVCGTSNAEKVIEFDIERERKRETDRPTEMLRMTIIMAVSGGGLSVWICVMCKEWITILKLPW